MDSILLQKQIRDNAEELRSYLQDLKNWESEMKRKEAEIHSEDSGSQSHPPVRSKIKKSKGQKKCENEGKKSSKISGFDYESWDKFDVDKACEALDNENTEEDDDDDYLSKIEKERIREEAVYEKERGNDFVKKQKWKEAIQCYSRAIKCYPHDAIFYANRGLCYLKIQDLKSAEADCTTALQLDANYVKAYQRRAIARTGLGQLLEARGDLLKVMEIEPNNMASKAELTKIEKKINIKLDGKGIDKQSGSATPKNNDALKLQQEIKSSKELHCKEAEQLLNEKEYKKSPVKDIGEIKEEPPCTSSNKDITKTKLENKASSSSTNKIIEQELDVSRLTDNKTVLWSSNSAVKLVKPIQKAPHLRSKKPLKRIAIREVDNSTLIEDKAVSELLVTSIVTKDLENENSSDDTKFLIVKEQKQEKIINHTGAKTKNIGPTTKETSESQNTIDKDSSTRNAIDFQSNIEDITNQVPPVPSTSVQFYVEWKKVKSNPQLSYLYLKQIPGSELARLFGDSLESSTFSEIISTFKTHFIQFKEHLLPYVIGLTKVRRFGALVMFLSEADKAGIKKILHYCRDQGECSHEEFTDLLKTYEV